jgi:predicted CXXCH cytochrome family protein
MTAMRWIAALALVACAAPGPPGTGVPGDRGPASNILRADYAGSPSCAGCHPGEYAAWLRSPMHNMTRLPGGATVRAPFDGREWHYRQDTARFHQAAGERYLEILSPRFGDHTYRVTRVIGGRRREDFAGVEVAPPRCGWTGQCPIETVGNPAAELVLPVSWVIDPGAFRLKGYSVMVTERPGLKAGGVWNQTCVLCHNTAPLFDSLWGELHGPGAPGYQGEVVDRVLPRERRSSLVVTDSDGLGEALRAEIERVSGMRPAARDPHALLATAASTLRSRLVPEQLVEVGIGCESCHGGSRAHVERNGVLPSFTPRASFLSVRPQATRAEAINRTCARCHQVLFSRYPYTWEGGLRRQDPGGSHITSGEARDFLLGGCARQMSCTTCHDPHGADDASKLAALATPAGNTVCAGCHAKYTPPAALRAHAHHDPAGAGGSCVACHMPRKNMGLGYELTRYHRIGSPTDAARVEGDRPLECALCHPRARVGELLTAMESWWGKRYDRGKLRGLYGDLSAPVLGATLARGKPHEQATAIAVLGEARDEEARPALAAALAHPYPLLRYYARHALAKLGGKPLAIDVDGEAAGIRTQVGQWLGAELPALPPSKARPSMEPDED